MAGPASAATGLVAAPAMTHTPVAPQSGSSSCHAASIDLSGGLSMARVYQAGRCGLRQYVNQPREKAMNETSAQQYGGDTR